MSAITTCPRRVARQHLHHRVGRPVAQRSLVHLDHRAQARVQFDYPAPEVDGHHRGALVRRDDEHLRRRLSVPDEVYSARHAASSVLPSSWRSRRGPVSAEGQRRTGPRSPPRCQGRNLSAVPAFAPLHVRGVRQYRSMNATTRALPDFESEARCSLAFGSSVLGPAVTPDGIGRADQRPASGGRSGSGVEVVRPQRIAHRVRVRGVVGLHPCH